MFIPSSIEERYRSHHIYETKQRELNEAIESRTRQEVRAFKEDRQEYTASRDTRMYILHVSDLHLWAKSDAELFRRQLQTDLRDELGIDRLNFMVVSGDIGQEARKEDYDAAFDFFDPLAKRFGLDPSRIVLVPGNHDVSWDAAEAGYTFTPARKLPSDVPPEKCIPAGPAGVLVRNEDAYRLRFSNFSKFCYQRIYSGVPYPLEFAEQGIVYSHAKENMLFVGLNSAWEIDHY